MIFRSSYFSSHLLSYLSLCLQNLVSTETFLLKQQCHTTKWRYRSTALSDLQVALSFYIKSLSFCSSLKFILSKLSSVCFNGFIMFLGTYFVTSNHQLVGVFPIWTFLESFWCHRFVLNFGNQIQDFLSSNNFYWLLFTPFGHLFDHLISIREG
jgi:hypothetical protein